MYSDSVRTIFKIRDIVKRNDTGERVTILDVMPNSAVVLYRVENEAGHVTTVVDAMLREVF